MTDLDALEKETFSGKRRSFIRILFTSSILLFVAALFPFTRYLTPKPKPVVYPMIKVATETDVQPGKAFMFTYPAEDTPAFLIRLPTGELKAYSAICTHLRVPLRWDEEKGKIICLAHGGVFDPTDGHVVAGPPPRPLPQVLLEVDEEKNIYAFGLKS